MTDMPAWQVTPIQAIKKVWEKIAPLQLAERSWDNVGIMIGEYDVFRPRVSVLTIQNRLSLIRHIDKYFLL